MPSGDCAPPVSVPGVPSPLLPKRALRFAPFMMVQPPGWGGGIWGDVCTWVSGALLCHLQRPAHKEPFAGFELVSHACRVELSCAASAPLAGGIGSTNPETHPGLMRLCRGVSKTPPWTVSWTAETLCLGVSKTPSWAAETLSWSQQDSVPG